MKCSSTRSGWWALAAALVAAACDGTPRTEIALDLATGGVSVAEGRPVPLVVDLGPDGVRRIVQHPGTRLEFFVRAPADARLVVRLDAATAPESVRVSSGAGGAVPTPRRLHGGEGGVFVAALADAMEGTMVRLVLENAGDVAVGWGEPRIVGTAASVPPILPATLRRTERPTNIVLVLADALRADHTSLLGYHRPTTPVLERLAAVHGVVFERAYAPGPSTWNSIPTLFTSLPASAVGVNFAAGPGRPARTLAMALDLAGFQTAAFVGNPMLLGDYGYGRGFGTYEIVWGDHGRPHLASARALVDRALEYLSVNRAASSFLYVHLMDTHTPYAPAPPHRDRFVGTGGPRAPTPARVVEEVPWLPLAPSMQSLFGEGLTPDQFDPDRYDEAIATVDAEFGRLVDGVAALGLGERTLFVLTADHGEALGLEDDGRRIHGHALFEELVHVPLVVVAPWLAGGRRVAEVVGLIDVAPTLLDLVGGAIPDTFLGQSLFVSPPPLEPPAALVERLEPRWNRTVVFGAGRHGVAEWGFREDRWKLLLDPQRVRLFDVVADPKETRDVAAAHPDVVGYLAQRLGQASPSLRGVAAPVVDPSADGPRLKDALRALGYMEP